jgi:hypothetical protein
MGLGLAAWSNWENGPRHGDVVHVPSVLAARSPCAVRACDGMVARSLTTWWWLANDKV